MSVANKSKPQTSFDGGDGGTGTPGKTADPPKVFFQPNQTISTGHVNIMLQHKVSTYP